MSQPNQCLAKWTEIQDLIPSQLHLILPNLIGECSEIRTFLINSLVAGILVSSLVGLIPNCAGSVIITELYLANLISFGSMIAGLLVGSGIGSLVLFKSNKHVKENIKITTILYLIGVICGIVLDLI